MAIDPEYERVRSLSDKDIIKECVRSRVRIVRELANRYDVVCEKLELSEQQSVDPFAPIVEKLRQIGNQHHPAQQKPPHEREPPHCASCSCPGGPIL